jgi:ABC-type lipoprotein export system ATPase subunit
MGHLVFIYSTDFNKCLLPEILLCYGPSGDLDVKNEAVIMEILREENRIGATAVMTTHNLNLKSFASRFLPMKDGRIS